MGGFCGKCRQPVQWVETYPGSGVWVPVCGCRG